jgi:hypothetical protein
VTDESVELLGGRAFKTIVHPLSDAVLTLTIDATDGHCSASFTDTVPPAPQQPPTDSISAGQPLPVDSLRPVLLGSVAVGGAALWFAKRRRARSEPVH